MWLLAEFYFVSQAIIKNGVLSTVAATTGESSKNHHNETKWYVLKSISGHGASTLHLANGWSNLWKSAVNDAIQGLFTPQNFEAWRSEIWLREKERP
jgi:hypothetical protein